MGGTQMNSWIKHRRRGGELPGGTALVTIRKQTFAFNKQFTLQAELQNFKRVSFFVEPDKRKIGFEFHSDATDEDSYPIMKDGGGSRSVQGRVAQPPSLFKEHSWLAAVARLPDPHLRRFKPQWDSVDCRWVIYLCPGFEVQTNDKTKIPSGVEGIYRCKRKDEVVYIGRGAIRSRLSAPERNTWDFDAIEYSPIENRDEQKKWEKYWLDRFFDEYGKLPLYNLIGGEKPKPQR
jgi:hypothetical protein